MHEINICSMSGGKQIDLINVIEAEDVPVCSSKYGLCE